LSLVRAAATVGSLTLLSRLLGFVRDVMIAAILGASGAADAFFVSFKLANLLRRLFAEGAFNAGFVPLFARTLEGEGEASARSFAEATLSWMAAVLLVVVLVAELTMPWLVRGLASGFAPGGERFLLAVELSRITFPYLLFISLAALFSGVLNARGRFAAAAAAPIALNIVLIVALLLALRDPRAPAHVLAWGVAVAGVVQLALVAAAAAADGFGLRPRPLPRDPRLGRLFRLVLPGAVGAGVYQINLVVDTWFASHLPAGAVSYLFYADRLNQLPLGLIGVALGTALLPSLSRQIRSGDVDTAQRWQNRAIELGLLLTLPAAAALVTIAGPIIHVLFERGAFGAHAAAATAGALSAFSVGLPAYVLIKVLAPAFFAREDTRTPVIVAAVCLAFNIVIILLLIGHLAHVGIALATALANWLNALILAVLLWRRGYFRPDRRLLRRVPRMLIATGVMAVALAALQGLLPEWPATLRLAAMIAAGAALFVVAAQLLGAADLRELARELRPARA
jgi:putative peptidoglycan lipid II flippase